MNYEGLLIQCAEDPDPARVYIVLPEGASWIPTAPIAEALFGANWGSEVQHLSLSEFNNIPKAPSLGLNAVLAQGNPEDTNKIYLVTGNQKRWITSPSVMDKYDFENGTVIQNQIVLSAIPDGVNIT